MFKVMKNFGSEFNGKFLCVVNGKVKKAFSRKAPALRWCIRYSVNLKNYVELCCQNSDGYVIYLNYWN